jgi:methionyl-tRNA formyltransferase
VITRAEKRRGRNEAPRPTPVGLAAAELGLPVSYRVEDATTVVVAFGRIIRPDVLAALPMVNVHFSLLPRWRGAAPVERAILAGDRVTGVCLMVVAEGLDTGPVYACREVPIEAGETAAALTARLAGVGAGLLVESLAGRLGDPAPQTGEPTYAEKITPADLHLDWTCPAEQLHRVVRVGRAWTTWRGDRLLVLLAEPVEGDLGRPGSLRGDAVATGSGGLRLITVQPEGRRAIPAAEWLRGARPQPGEALGG